MTFPWSLPPSRRLGLLAWLGALFFCAWTLADIILRLSAPATIATSWAHITDPRQAVREINLAAPLSAQTSSEEVAPANDDNHNASYTLIGIATGFADYDGFALLKPAGGSVQAVPLGAEVSPGVRLSALTAQYVELERNGQHEKIPLQKNNAAQTATPPITPQSP